jgi:hypothetical protein
MRWWALGLLTLSVVSGFQSIGAPLAIADDFEDRCVLLAAANVPTQVKIVTASVAQTEIEPPKKAMVEFSVVVGDRKMVERFECRLDSDFAVRVRPLR